MRTWRRPRAPLRRKQIRYDKTVLRRSFLQRSVLGLLPAIALAAEEEKVSDDLLYDRVNRELITDRELGARQLKVAVKDGKVTITGFVESEKQKKKVEKVAKKVKGVVAVDNRTTVRPDL